MIPFVLKCEVSEGQFSTERAIAFKTAKGEATSGFVSDRDVVEGGLLVYIMEERGGLALILLPREFFHGSHYVTVSRAVLKEDRSNGR